MLLEMYIVQHIQTKSVFTFQPKEVLVYDCKKCKACSQVLNIPFEDQKLTIMLFYDTTYCFARKTNRDYEKLQPSPFLKILYLPITIKHTRTCAKESKNHTICGIIVDSPLVDTINQKFISILHFHNQKFISIIHFQPTVKQHFFISLQRRY